MRIKLSASTEQIQLILANYRGFGFGPVDADLVAGALDLADHHSISFWDALIVEAAGRSGCKTLYSEDLSSGQLIRGIRVTNPFAA